MRNPFRRSLRVPVLIVLTLLSCMDTDSDGVPDEGLLTVPREEAPTGAKLEINEYGEAQILDEECGGIGSAAYAEYFQSAMFRDAALGGATTQPVLYAVDGAHLWRAAVSGTTLSAPEIWQRFIGRATAVQATTEAVFVGTIDGDVLVYDHQGAWLRSLPLGAPVMDLALSSSYLIAAVGQKGLMSLELAALISGADAYRDMVVVDNYAAGVRFAEEISGASGYAAFAYAACRTAGVVMINPAGVFHFTVRATADLVHHNAKDAVVGPEGRLAIANNGLGLWFVNPGSGPGDPDFKQILDADPAFYANSVVLNAAQTQVYLAAGNQSLQMHAFDRPEPPPPPVRRDPIDVEYVQTVSGEARVLGLGNFRQVGERTMLWSDTGLLGVDELRETGGGWLSQAAPADVSGEAGLLLARPDVLGFSTYFLPATAVAAPALWRRVYDGLYVRLEQGLLTTPVTTVASSRLNLQLYSGDLTDTVGVVILGHSASDPYERMIAMLDEIPEIVVGPLAPWIVPSESAQAIPGSMTPVVMEYVVPRSTMERVAPCGLAPAARGPSFLERTGYGAVADGDAYLVWCSRKDDPWVPGKAAQNDTGTLLYRCMAPESVNATPGCTRLAGLADSNVLAIWPRPDGGYWALADDRRSYAYSLLQLDTSYRVHDRWLFSGRPVGWLKHDSVLTWVDERGQVRDLSLLDGIVSQWTGGAP